MQTFEGTYRNSCAQHLAAQLQFGAECSMAQIELFRMLGYNNVARTWPNEYNTMQHPEMLQHVVRNI